MNGSKYSYKIALAMLATALACGCAEKLVSHSGGTSLEAVSQRAAQKSADSAADRTAQTPGLVVHIDPVTGEILAKPAAPPPGQIPDAQQFQSAPVTAPPAFEEASPEPGGGVKVKLNRQFHQPLFAIIDDDGKIRFGHRLARPRPEVK